MPRSLQAVAVLTMILFASPSLANGEYQLQNGDAVEIVKVKEGEVFLGRVVDGGHKIDVRLLGVDCPKGNDRGASGFAREQLVGQIVTVSSERPPIPPAMDQFDRWIVYLQLEDGSDYGMNLLGQGHCTAKTWSMPHQKRTEYASLN